MTICWIVEDSAGELRQNEWQPLLGESNTQLVILGIYRMCFRFQFRNLPKNFRVAFVKSAKTRMIDSNHPNFPV
jgi:hypothetical protein